MASQPTSTPRPPVVFENALDLLHRRREIHTLSTGSPELDTLTGRLELGLFYLFYGPDSLPDRLLHRLLIEAVRGKGDRAVYLVCGNYRRSRTMLDSELLLSLIDEAGLDAEDALSRIHFVSAFSERHLIRAPDLVEGLLEGAGGFSLIAVQQLTKLFYGKHALRHENPAEFTGIVSRLKAMCFERGISLAATARASVRGRPIPRPEGGNFLSHAANVIVYLRETRGGSLSAYVVKHPERGRTGRTVHFGEVRNSIWEG
jgi:hypothetical protein